MSDVVGRVAITWPAASTPPSALASWGVRIDDLEAAEPILDAVALELKIGSSAEGWSDHVIEVALTRLVDTDGKPIGNGPGSANRLALTDEHAEWQASHIPAGPDAVFPGQKYRTAEFRYIVAEVGVNLTPPGTEPRLAVGARVNVPNGPANG